MQKLIITLAPTGNVPTKALTPFAAISQDEIVSDLKEALNRGVSLGHLHVRDDQGNPSSERQRFKTLMDQVKNENLNVITQLSTGARGGENTLAYRSQMLDLMPEMASLSPGSSNFPTSVNANSPDLVKKMCEMMLAYNIKPEIEVFDLSMIYSAQYLKKKGLIKGPLHFNLVMNVPGALPGTPKTLMTLVDHLPQDATFTVSGIGKVHTQMMAMAIALGGHVRTGLEDVILLDGKIVSNLDLVDHVVALAKAHGRPIANADEARGILNL